MSDGSTLAVIAVHGTFVRRAAWFRPDSVLRTSISRSSGPGTWFGEVEWSGRNSHLARERAASKFVRYVHDDVPVDRKAFVVAHSHGGNVVLSALRSDPSLSSRISGIVTVSTPFLRCTRRDVGAASRLLTGCVIALVSALVYFLVAGAIGMSSDPVGELVVMASLATLVPGVFLTRFSNYVIARRPLERHRRVNGRSRQAILLEELEVSAPPIPICYVLDDNDLVPRWLKAIRALRLSPQLLLTRRLQRAVAFTSFVTVFAWGHGPGQWHREPPTVVTDEAIRIATETPNPGGMGAALTILHLYKAFPMLPRAIARVVTVFNHAVRAFALTATGLLLVVLGAELLQLIGGRLLGTAPWAFGSLRWFDMMAPWLLDFYVTTTPPEGATSVDRIQATAPDWFGHSPLSDARTCTEVVDWIARHY